MYYRTTAVAALLVLAAGAAWSHGGSHEKKPAAKAAHVNAEQHVFGRAGDPKKVTRTINVGMDDSMHFSSGDLEMKRGDTEPYMAHVAPGKVDEIVWQFTRASEFYYACLIPGHLEAGMIGKIIVK